ncbi:MAG: deoxyguanosinetriphosphate triphosphohydrolase [Sedimentisphaerales bacterium]|nr:deoxyguanosinetriphosphate triphosphohydrolase [Sedimentisphaerales bacterium]
MYPRRVTMGGMFFADKNDMCGKIFPYAVTEEVSKGRKFTEKRHAFRSDFERDRDRIIHCAAFRRLEGKTQVFTPGLDDYYRTRLTHTIEVAQIGRTIAKALGLNENLTEAICLAHDLGHSPFGHTGEGVLNDLMKDFGGFEHNRQSLRVVDLLEHPYPDFAGLNLMYETRLGLAKHHSPYDNPEGGDFPESNCSLEGQVANIADRVAVSSHDLEDGLRARVINAEQLKDIDLFQQAQDRVQAEKIEDKTIRRTRTAKAIIDKLVSECVEESRIAINRRGIESVDDVYHSRESLITLPKRSVDELLGLERFLLDNFYHHTDIVSVAKQVETWLDKLFEYFCGKPEAMPHYFRKFIEMQGLQRAVCDYIAGMTDRFCLKMLKEI